MKSGLDDLAEAIAPRSPARSPEELLAAVQADTNAWTWYVVKKWEADDSKPLARWSCLLVTPITPEGEFQTVYADDIKRSTWRVK